jgi:hypothetical protein
MRLRLDRRAEIGAFEDLQTLLVVVVGITVLLGSTLYNWGLINGVDREQQLYDGAEDILRSVEAQQVLRAGDAYGSPYPTFMLRQPSLASYHDHPANLDEAIKSDLNYNLTFEDLDLGSGEVNATAGMLRVYAFGLPLPETGVETVALATHYALVMEKGGELPYNVSLRHLCLATVVVWR